MNLTFARCLFQWRRDLGIKMGRSIPQTLAAEHLAQLVGFPISLRTFSRWENGNTPGSKVKYHIVMEEILPQESKDDQVPD